MAVRDSINNYYNTCFFCVNNLHANMNKPDTQLFRLQLNKAMSVAVTIAYCFGRATQNVIVHYHS